MTNNFKRSIGLIGIVVAILLGVFLWMKHQIERVVILPYIPHANTRFMPDDRQLIEFNEKTHHVTVTTSSGTLRMYARDPAVHVKLDGRIVVDRHLFGFQNRFSAGLGYGDTIRGMVGWNPVYWGGFEASAAAGFTLDENHPFVKPYVNAGYNFWGNLLVNGGINPVSLFRKEVDYVAFVSIKI